jgi:hypothetical protein
MRQRTEQLLAQLFESVNEGSLHQQVSELVRFIVDHASDRMKLFLLDEVLAFDYTGALNGYLGSDLQQAIRLARIVAKDAHVEPPEVAREPSDEPEDEPVEGLGKAGVSEQFVRRHPLTSTA